MSLSATAEASDHALPPEPSHGSVAITQDSQSDLEPAPQGSTPKTRPDTFTTSILAVSTSETPQPALIRSGITTWFSGNVSSHVPAVPCPLNGNILPSALVSTESEAKQLLTVEVKLSNVTNPLTEVGSSLCKPNQHAHECFMLMGYLGIRASNLHRFPPIHNKFHRVLPHPLLKVLQIL